MDNDIEGFSYGRTICQKAKEGYEQDPLLPDTDLV